MRDQLDAVTMRADKFPSGQKDNSSPELEFRMASLADTILLSALHDLCFKPILNEPWTPDTFAQLIAMPGTTALIAIRHEDLATVGFLIFRVAADECEIISLGVDPGARRQAVATRLLAHIYGHIQAAGAARVFLEVAADNSAARSFYQNHGFIEVGVRLGYYARSGAARTDAAVLRLDLP